ncbi:zinc finger family protein [Trypanosoma grayi]|uniref:zinc finger family protein n=1 Tax=Trypanosoma grayi TaxID=71804 RepID=UPI0004F4B3ED|nr:zinc finger family protein [Trypanosoma grayi]KEG12929.1 zinc finger family protein [Trypanosoma grayi]
MSSPAQHNLIDRIAAWDAATPHESLIADSVEDAFELLAPSVNGPLVARLVPLHADAAAEHLLVVDICRDSGCITLGRSRELVVECRVDVARVSGRHCELRVDPVTRQVTIRDLSTNGTYVNGKRLEKGVEVELESGDHVFLTKPGEADTVGAAAAEYMFQRVSSATSVGNMEEELTCSVCKSLYLRPCSMLPCMHVFCAACISKWLADGNTTCFECRAEVTEVRPTHKIQSCVEQLLKAKPHLGRTAEEQAECAAADSIPPTGRKLRKRFRNDDYIDEESSGGSNNSFALSDEEGVHAPPQYNRSAYGHPRPTGPCRHCETASAVDSYRCPDGGLHQVCSQCRRLFPQRPLCPRPQRCQLCSVPYCNLYYEEEGGCHSSNDCGLIHLRRYHAPSSLPEKTFGGNSVEQSILSNYLTARGIQVEAVWKECMEKLESGEWIPDITCVSGQLTVDSALCENCMQTVFASLLFHYRRAVPSSELPETVRNRPNCWYGINCRTQFHKMQHANNYSHVCYQEKRKE